MSFQKENGIWKGYKQLLLPLGHKADVNELTTLASILVDSEKGEIEFIHVIKEGSYTTLSREWREGAKRVTESHHLMMESGIHSQRNIVKAQSIEKGILSEAEEIFADAILLGWGPKPRSHISALASNILSKARSDVIIYKKRVSFQDIKKIVYPIAVKPNISRLQLILQFVIEENAELTFVHVAPDNDKKQKLGQELLDRAVELANTVSLDPETKLLTANNVMDKITDVSKDYDLMVLGPSGGWWLERTIFGDLADKIAINSACSVVLHKAAGD